MPRNEFMGHPEEEPEVPELDENGDLDRDDYSWGPGDVDWQLREQLKKKIEAGSITAKHQLEILERGQEEG